MPYELSLQKMFMSQEKKPDQVVYNEETKRYDSFLKAYPTTVGAPSIELVDSTTWKAKGSYKANKQLHSKYQELKAEYEKILETLEHNNLVYNAKFNFEPIIGETYHLYRDKKEEVFLSIIPPADCSFDYVASFYLNSEHIWMKKEMPAH